MNLTALSFISFLAIVIAIYHRVVFYGIFRAYNPPPGRFFALTRLVLRPVHAVYLWFPVRPTSEIRIAGLLAEGHRHPRLSKRLLNRTAPELLIVTVSEYLSSPISAVMAEHAHHLLHDSAEHCWDTINHLMVELIDSPELLLRIALIELEELTPGSDPELVAYAVARSRALTLDVMKALSAGTGLLVASFAASNLDAPDPIHALWPTEERSTLGHILYFTRQLSHQHATFADLLDEINSCVPTHQPGWAEFALPLFRSTSIAQTVRFPTDGVGQLKLATAPLRQHDDCITKAAQLSHAGTPGDFPQLVEVVRALRREKPAS